MVAGSFRSRWAASTGNETGASAEPADEATGQSDPKAGELPQDRHDSANSGEPSAATTDDAGPATESI